MLEARIKYKRDSWKPTQKVSGRRGTNSETCERDQYKMCTILRLYLFSITLSLVKEDLISSVSKPIFEIATQDARPKF